MTKEELAEYISSNYGADGEYPWAAYPHYSVFRHTGNKKWFAVIMKLPASKVVTGGEGERYFVNLKTDPPSAGLTALRDRHTPGLSHEQDPLAHRRHRKFRPGAFALPVGEKL